MDSSNPSIEAIRTISVFIFAFYISAIVMLAICFLALYLIAGEYLKASRLVIGEVLVYTKFPAHGSPKLVT